MDTNQARQMALTLMFKHGLTDPTNPSNQYSGVWSFQFDRSIRRLGFCNYTARTISLGLHATSVNDEVQVRNTILHEIAHALCGHIAGHGPEWKAKHRAIGGDGQRLGHIEERAAHTWEMQCGICQHIWKRYRKPSATLIHAKCGSKLTIYRVGK